MIGRSEKQTAQSNIHRAKSQTLSWERLADDHIVDGLKPALIEKHNAYFTVRMKEMYVAYSRKLWRKYYPMLHSYVEGVHQDDCP